MRNDILRDGFQPIVASQQMILPAKFAFQLLLLLRIKFNFLDHFIDIFVQIRIDELQLRRTVLVEERYGGTVLNGLIERLIRIFQTLIIEDKAFDDKLTELLSGPNTKAGGDSTFDSVANRDNGIKVVIISTVLLTISGSCKEILYN